MSVNRSIPARFGLEALDEPSRYRNKTRRVSAHDLTPYEPWPCDLIDADADNRRTECNIEWNKVTDPKVTGYQLTVIDQNNP